MNLDKVSFVVCEDFKLEKGQKLFGFLLKQILEMDVTALASVKWARTAFQSDMIFSVKILIQTTQEVGKHFSNKTGVRAAETEKEKK